MADLILLTVMPVSLMSTNLECVFNPCLLVRNDIRLFECKVPLYIKLHNAFLSLACITCMSFCRTQLVSVHPR